MPGPTECHPGRPARGARRGYRMARCLLVGVPVRAIRCAFAILLLPLAALAQTVGPGARVWSSSQTLHPSGSTSVNFGTGHCRANKPIDFAFNFTNAGSTPTAGTD